MPDHVEEHIRVLAREGAVDDSIPSSEFDTMSEEQFCAKFTIRKHRAMIQSVFRAHQHNRDAGHATLHVLKLEAFMSQNEIISCPVAVARIMVTRVRGLKLKIKRALGLVRVKRAWNLGLRVSGA